MKKKLFIFLSTLLISAGCLFAESTPIEKLYNYKLKNGLSLFVAENHTVPLVYIEIAVKAGAISQTPENAGLFHLYEHMMFKGNKKYKNAEAIQDELTNLGVSNWNGSTAQEYVNYYFTIPSDRLEEGLDFWNQAIRNPLMNSRELEDEKQVVLSEINANKSDPSHFASFHFMKEMFYEAPWLTDASGNPEVVQNATVAQLRNIQKNYYIPNNCALFVGGDVDPEEVCVLTEKLYGSWKKGRDPWINQPSQPDTDPFRNPEGKPALRVIPMDTVSDSLAVVEINYRGPDAAFNEEDTYAADVLLTLLADPQGFFKQGLTQNLSLAIPNTDYVSASYLTRRYLGVFNAEIVLTKPEIKLASRINTLYEQVPLLIEQMIPDSSPLSLDQLATVRQRLINDQIYEQETASGLLSSLRFWWTCTSEDYYYSYTQNLQKITGKEIEAFINKYIKTKTPIITVYLNKDSYEYFLKDELKDYKVITQDDSYWWQK